MSASADTPAADRPGPDLERWAPAAGRLTTSPLEPLIVEGEPVANLVELIHRSCVEHADQVALQWKPARVKRPAGEADSQAPSVTWKTTTYRETWDWIRDVSLGLRTLGVAAGDRVCILCRTRPAWLIVDLASMALGAVTCPIYPSMEANQAAFIINNVGCQAHRRRERPAGRQGRVDPGRVPDPREGGRHRRARQLPTGTITLRRRHRPGATPIRTIGASGRTAGAPIGRDQLATIIHTSGTTANPKGVMLTHGNLVYNYEAVNQVVDFFPSDTFLSWLPLEPQLRAGRRDGRPVRLGAARSPTRSRSSSACRRTWSRSARR